MKNKEKIPLGSLVAAGGALLYLKSRSEIPENAESVKDFDMKRYLGTWYEIARFNYRFEKNIDNGVAQYSQKEDNNVQLRNSGCDNKNKKWTVAKGIAKFREDKNIAALKVSFFGPFYACYNVIAIKKR